MTGWVILVDQAKDMPNADTPHKVITTHDYLARPRLFEGARPKVINLARSYNYQSTGYYASLLALARGHRVIPTVETMLELSARSLYEPALPELEDALNKAAKKAHHKPDDAFKLLVCFGHAEDERYESFGRLLFDWFRCPAMEVTVEPGEWLSIEKIKTRCITKLLNGHGEFFRRALEEHTRRDWKSPKSRPVVKYTLAVLQDPKEELPPSSTSTLKHFAKMAEKLSIEVQPITRKQLHQVAEFDALFIRETTSIDNHTYRFARRAVYENMPVIDDPVSMIRCTNKVYLMEVLAQDNVPMPPTVMLGGEDDLERAADELNFPIVVKIPDGSFSRGVHKVSDFDAFQEMTQKMFRETDLLLAQKFMPTAFDWRVGVLGGEPLFACQYHMAKGHWQIIKHSDGGKPEEGTFKTFALEDVPPEVIDTAVRAARTIGNGLYGVDVKQTPAGIFVIEVNDNPNLEHGVEDAVLKDELWMRIGRWFIERLETKGR